MIQTGPNRLAHRRGELGYGWLASKTRYQIARHQPARLASSDGLPHPKPEGDTFVSVRRNYRLASFRQRGPMGTRSTPGHRPGLATCMRPWGGGAGWHWDRQRGPMGTRLTPGHRPGLATCMRPWGGAAGWHWDRQRGPLGTRLTPGHRPGLAFGETAFAWSHRRLRLWNQSPTCSRHGSQSPSSLRTMDRCQRQPPPHSRTFFPKGAGGAGSQGDWGADEGSVCSVMNRFMKRRRMNLLVASGS